MAKGRTAFSSVKPVSYFRTGPYIRCSDGDSSGPGDFICKAYTATAVMATVSYRIEWLLLL